MSSILDIAQWIYEEYKRETKETIDEMKLHKLLYFAQRECLAITDEPLFTGRMEGWVHGPVSPDVRKHFSKEQGITAPTSKLNPMEERIIRNVIAEYGYLASWKLRDLSHKERSWKNSREGLSMQDRGNKTISIDDIKEDAKSIRPFDHTWGMFYDEFDDYEGELTNESCW